MGEKPPTADDKPFLHPCEWPNLGSARSVALSECGPRPAPDGGLRRLKPALPFGTCGENASFMTAVGIRNASSKKRVALFVSAVIAALLVGGTALAAPHGAVSPAADPALALALSPGANCHKLVNATSPRQYEGAMLWACTMNAMTPNGALLPPRGWANAIFEINCPAGCFANVTLESVGDFGAYFGLWETPDSSLQTMWSLVGTTPQVDTGPQLIASSYNPHWNANGITASERKFMLYAPAGIPEYLAVHENLFSQMTQRLDGPCGVGPATLLASGCSVSGISVGSGWSGTHFLTVWS
jgi:hypothetical protein